MKIRFLVSFGFMLNVATVQAMIDPNNVGTAALPVVVALAVLNPEHGTSLLSKKREPIHNLQTFYTNNSAQFNRKPRVLHQPSGSNHKRSKKA